VTIRKPRAELFAFWSDFSNLPQFMENVEAIEAGADGASTWRIKAPAGQTVAVKTEIASKKQNELIAWRSVEDSEIETSGEVRFEDAPGERGTRVSLVMAYDPP
ncbi:SRPBCC family protein, partial [Erythrobacter sp. HI0019]